MSEIVRWVINLLNKLFNKFEHVSSNYMGNSNLREDARGGMNLAQVAYDSQRDNQLDPLKTCFPTSIAMVLRTIEQPQYDGRGRAKYIGENCEFFISQDIENNLDFYRRIVKRFYGFVGYPRYFGKFWLWWLVNVAEGYSADRLIMSRQEIKDFIQYNRVPVVVPTKLTKSGHVIVVRGYNEQGFFVNDPFGDATEDYYYHDGENLFYPNELIEKKSKVLAIWNEY